MKKLLEVSQKRILLQKCIAYKEARETSYWLRILKDTGYLTKEQFVSIEQDINEILKIITSIQKISKSDN